MPPKADKKKKRKNDEMDQPGYESDPDEYKHQPRPPPSKNHYNNIPNEFIDRKINTRHEFMGDQADFNNAVQRHKNRKDDVSRQIAELQIQLNRLIDVNNTVIAPLDKERHLIYKKKTEKIQLELEDELDRTNPSMINRLLMQLGRMIWRFLDSENDQAEKDKIKKYEREDPGDPGNGGYNYPDYNGISNGDYNNY